MLPELPAVVPKQHHNGAVAQPRGVQRLHDKAKVLVARGDGSVVAQAHVLREKGGHCIVSGAAHGVGLQARGIGWQRWVARSVAQARVGPVQAQVVNAVQLGGEAHVWRARGGVGVQRGRQGGGRGVVVCHARLRGPGLVRKVHAHAQEEVGAIGGVPGRHAVQRGDGLQGGVAVRQLLSGQVRGAVVGVVLAAGYVLVAVCGCVRGRVCVRGLRRVCAHERGSHARLPHAHGCSCDQDLGSSHCGGFPGW